jgi:bifunctional UDP-N-acetylglucosamine pyrophosphorylase/glucosamine-1-phosphate N-acetyltransferase
VAAGSVVNADVPEDALAIARERQENKLKWAAQFRARYK